MQKLNKIRWIWCLAVVIVVLAGCTHTPEQQAIKLCVTASKVEPVATGFHKPDYEYSAKPIGPHSWMVTRIVSGLMPRKADKSFIVYKNKATPYTLDRLIMVFGSDVPVSLKNPEQDQSVKLFVEMMDRGEATFTSKVINGVDDIYNYKTAPLKPEIEATIHPPKIETMPDGSKKHTFFAHRVGHGILRRYEFTFNRSGQLTDVSYTEVGKGIGGTYLLE